MQLNTFFTATLLGLTTALPTSRTTGSSKGFRLRVNVTDTTRDLTPSVQNLYLSSLRTGAGTAISTLTASTPTPSYLNGTAYHTTVVQDIPNVYPLSLAVAGPSDYDIFYPAEHPVGAAVNGGTELFLRPGEPILFPLDEGGVYAACERDVVLGGQKTSVLAARYVYGDESVPADCAPVEFVVECAVLPDLPEGSSWNHDFAFEVPCVRA
ncbi:hypothetical protein F5B22DRAFT_599843 [Xylaria bambusicola]|uniref:uncharacterized protein n=1 Tax=Xylaria bambusicola TaxID=326684 RepID=UPI00200738C9|nr:uncharacterized protein F5B22DRAFT_599843 [Xylaria bambusicola]KAI0518142.1 hypothetical protein F5B22DRAFT_599843 [Xylaria bambusicola]